MNHEETISLHTLLFSYMGMFHEKFLHRFRKNVESHSVLKKNQVKIISILYRFDNLTSTDISKRLDIEKGSVTTLIDQLAELGLIVRVPAPHDRRKSLLLLTELGRTEMERIIENDTRTMNELFHNIPPHDVQKFVDSLKYAVEFMNKL